MIITLSTWMMSWWYTYNNNCHLFVCKNDRIISTYLKTVNLKSRKSKIKEYVIESRFLHSFVMSNAGTWIIMARHRVAAIFSSGLPLNPPPRPVLCCLQPLASRDLLRPLLRPQARGRHSRTIIYRVYWPSLLLCTLLYEAMLWDTMVYAFWQQQRRAKKLWFFLWYHCLWYVWFDDRL